MIIHPCDDFPGAEPSTSRGCSRVTLVSAVGLTTLIAILSWWTLASHVSLYGDGMSKEDACRVQMTSLQSALDMYRRDNGRFPTTEQGLAALVERPARGPKPRRWRQYMVELPIDPWGNPYGYGSNGKGYALRTAGSPDPESSSVLICTDRSPMSRSVSNPPR